MATQSGNNSSVAVLGAGAWGTALALMLARRISNVYLWSIELTEVAAMLAERANQTFLPGFNFPDHIKPTAHLPEALSTAQDIFIAVPSIGFRSTLMIMKQFLNPKARLIIATKGLDEDTGKLLSEIVSEILTDQTYAVAVLSGPSFAREVAMGLPTSVVAASNEMKFAKSIQTQYQLPNFQIEISSDVIGVQLGSIVKNVIAIAIGFSDGMRLGANAKAALITRGLQEMTALGAVLGANEKTFYGLSGMGDLILTCNDDQSRNRRFGIGLAQGKSVSVIESELGHVAEGKKNVDLLLEIAQQHNINMPICHAVAELIKGELLVDNAAEKLFHVN